MAEEAKIQTRIINWLNTQENCWSVKTIATNKAGTPDIIVCWRGRFVGIEVKSSVGKLSKLQKFRRKEIEASGGTFIVARSVLDVMGVLNECG